MWPKNIKNARAVQIALKDRVKIIPLGKRPKFIAGVDVAFFEDKVIGAVCVFKYPEIIFAEEAFSVTKVSFPYIPGFLSF